MRKPIHLKLADVIAKGEKALDEGRLQIQQPLDKRGKTCLYRKEVDGKVCHCIIGVSLRGPTAQRFDDLPNNTILSLIEKSLVTSDHPHVLSDLQTTHDAAVLRRYPVDRAVRDMRAALEKAKYQLARATA